ncbi:hypothetical protein, partial [Amaricoccus solimangrovi]|uniref:hypothetical protein n=1 Tax=Amaricoccus solimangrovi TaxID=2589815 RepID=UPI001AEF2367
MEEWLIHNPPAPLRYWIGPDGSRTYATAFTSLALAPDEDPFGPLATRARRGTRGRGRRLALVSMIGPGRYT